MSVSSRLKKFRSDHKRLYFGALLGLALACVTVVIHGVCGPNGYLTYRRERREHRALEQDVRRLQGENQQLEKQVNALKSDPHAIERVAREKMRLARPGEVIFTLPGTTAKPPNADATGDTRPKR